MTAPTAAVVTAAVHLTLYRDGLVGGLMWLAEHTAEETPADAADIIARFLLVLEPVDRDRRALRITTIAGDCWGYFPEKGERRAEALATLRAVCKDTATAVRDVFHRDCCICQPARQTYEVTR
jgi:hypothetical protein